MCDKINDIVDAVTSARCLMALTGAGVSTLSGIPDFRSADGIYSQLWNNRPVEDILSLSCFRKEPELFYRWAKQFVYCCENYTPSVIHVLLAELEKKGYLKSLYTQNIDQLHTRAGNKDVYELHGSAASHRCLSCRTIHYYSEIAPLVQHDKLPRCRKCGGVVKPDIIFYEEDLDQHLLELAETELSRCDLLLILGTSLTVFPAAALPELTLRSGGEIIIVNAQATRLDRHAKYRFHDLATFGQAVLEAI